MKLQQTLKKYFSKESLINNICKYQLYYQIGLGNVALESIQDLEETYKKLDELNLQIDSQKVFESIHSIVLHLSHEDNFDEKFDSHLRMAALSQMLNDFAQADTELIGSQHYCDMVFEKIKDNTYFTQKMQEQVDEDFEFILPNWEAIITDDVVRDIQNTVELYSEE